MNAIDRKPPILVITVRGSTEPASGSRLLTPIARAISHRYAGEVQIHSLPYPATFESFDDKTLWLSIRFMPSFLKMLGPVKFIHLLLSLIPDGLQLLRVDRLDQVVGRNLQVFYDNAGDRHFYR